MYKSTVLILLFISLFIVFKQTSCQENPNTETQGVAANTIDNKKNEPSNETGITAQETAQNGNPSAKQPEEISTEPPVKQPNPKPKPKSGKKPKRRPRWRKRPRRPRKPRPTPKTQAKTKPKTESKEKQADSSKAKQSESTQSGTNSKDSIQEKPITNVNAVDTQVMDTKITKEIQAQDAIQTEPMQDTVQPQNDPVPSADVQIINEPQAQVQPEPIVKSKTKAPLPKQSEEMKIQNDMPIVDKVVEPVNKPKPAKKDRNISKPKPNRKAKETKAAVESKPQQGGGAFADLEGFFDQFDMVTEANLAAPPNFDPNKKPGKKVLPTVDPDKGVAHDGTPCAVNYKEHPTDKTKYMMRLPDDVWQAADCPPNLSQGLVWRQDLCNCGEELIPQDPNDLCGLQGYNPHPNNRHKYMRRHHGINNVMDCPANLVWSQKVCLCLFDPDAVKPIEPTVTFVCKTILNLTFEDRLQNTAEGYYVKPVAFGRRSKIPRIRFVKTPGADGLAAQIVSQPLQFQAFRGNDFQKQVTFSLNFKVSGRRRKSKNFMLLLTDECQRTQSGVTKQWEPSISLSFQPNTKTFKLLFRTEEKQIEELITGAKPDNQGWYKVVVYFEDRTVNLENNGKKLFSVNGVKGKIPPNRCPLYIAGKGKGYDKRENFYGYMDNIFLVKDCTFHESNIKIL